MDEPPPSLAARRWIVCGLSATLLTALVVLALTAIQAGRGSALGADGFFIAMTLGLVAVWQCPVALWVKIVGCVLYVPVMGIALMGLGAQFACSVYGRCL